MAKGWSREGRWAGHRSTVEEKIAELERKAARYRETNPEDRPTRPPVNTGTTRPVPPAIAAGHQHAEAFCLMAYATDDRSEIEVLWNSRDGVTPFVISSRVTCKEMSHIAWSWDEYRPDFVPPIGSRMFVDISRQHALMLAARAVDSRPELLADAIASRDAMVQRVAEDYYQPGAPMVVEVGSRRPAPEEATP